MRTTDFFALLSIYLAMCAVLLRFAFRLKPRSWEIQPWAYQLMLVFVLTALVWVPWMGTGLPLLGYARGVMSDLSFTTVLLMLHGAAQQAGITQLNAREKYATFGFLGLVAVVLYPTALGWGDWDAYRLGWDAMGLVIGLLIAALWCWALGLQLLPWVMAAAVAGWALGALESGNLWDYLIDPWLACASIIIMLRAAWRLLRQSLRGTAQSST